METVEIKVLLFATAREAAGNVSSVFCKLETPADTQKLRYGKGMMMVQYSFGHY